MPTSLWLSAAALLAFFVGGLWAAFREEQARLRELEHRWRRLLHRGAFRAATPVPSAPPAAATAATPPPGDEAVASSLLRPEPPRLPPPSAPQAAESPSGQTRVPLLRDEGWLAPGETRSVHGHTLDGWVYVGEHYPAANGVGREPAMIVPSLPVAPAGLGRTSQRLQSYEQLDPASRGEWLQWLARGRQGAVSYRLILLFLAGLERRLVGSPVGAVPPAEAAQLLREIAALHDQYPGGRTVRTAAQRLYELGRALYQQQGALPELAPAWAAHLAVAQRLAERVPLPTETLVRYALAAGLGASCAEKVPSEFTALLRLRYQRAWPEGLSLAPQPGSSLADYTPLNPGLHAVPDWWACRYARFAVDELQAHLSPLLHATESDLSGYARAVNRSKDSEQLALLSLLPLELLAEHPWQADLAAWAAGLTTEWQCLTLKELLSHALPRLPRQTVVERSCQGLAMLLEAGGLGMVPDPRLDQGHCLEHHRVLVFRLLPHDPAAESPPFAVGWSLLTLAVAVRIEPIAPPEAEQRALRLAAGLKWGPALTQRLRMSARWLGEVRIATPRTQPALDHSDGETRARYAELLCDAVLRKRAATQEQLVLLERAFKALGLNREQLFDHLQGQPLHGQASSTDLDATRLARRQQETEAVTTVLSAVFEAATPSPATGLASPAPAPAGPGMNGLGLDATLQRFVIALLARPRWTPAELAALAKPNRLMVEGALERINAAAERHWGEPLIEGDNEFYINLRLSKELLHEHEHTPAGP